MISGNTSIEVLRRELRASMDDRSRLTKLHSAVTESIKNSYGEERVMLTQFRQDVKDALNCRLP